MNKVEAFGVLVATITLLAMGFGAGKAHERRRRLNRSLQVTLETVRKALSNVEVSSLLVIPPLAALGTQVCIEYDVTSRLTTSLEVWLGADIEYAVNAWFYDVAQDKVVSIEPGRHTYRRYLTLAPPLPPGPWSINAGIWFGTKSDPDRSIRLVLKRVDISVANIPP
jgi:hypothetical protein